VEIVTTGFEISLVNKNRMPQKIAFRAELQSESLEKQKTLSVTHTVHKEMVQYKHVFNEQFTN